MPPPDPYHGFESSKTFPTHNVPEACLHKWAGLSSHGNPVLGISRCSLCRARATSSDLRLFHAARRLREFNERPGFDAGEVRDAFIEADR